MHKENSTEKEFFTTISKWKKKWEQSSITRIWINAWTIGLNIRVGSLMIVGRGKAKSFESDLVTGPG